MIIQARNVFQIRVFSVKIKSKAKKEQNIFETEKDFEK